MDNLFNMLPRNWRELILPNIPQSVLDRINVCYKNDVLIHNKKIYPPYHKIFKVFELLNPEDIKLIILGQDCYHGIGEANGIAFSVDKRLGYIPPSLRNIYKELNQSLPDFEIPFHGDLTDWVKQGVFLLNSTLTVEQNKPNSNYHYNWFKFTDVVVELLSLKYDNLVFMLWGNFAKQKKEFIHNKENHKILETTHPSPFSANKGFLGNKHFILANRYLRKHSKEEIQWKIQ